MAEPFTLSSYLWRRAYDINIIFVIFFPSFLALALPFIDREAFAIVFDVLILVEFTWIINFLLCWPIEWTGRLRVTKQHLLNYINSIKIALDCVSEGPETQLNRKIVVNNLLLVKNLQQTERCAWCAAVLSIPACCVLMAWVRSRIFVSREAALIFSDPILAVFAFWCSIRVFLMIAARSMQMANSVETTMDVVNESNLGVFLEIFGSDADPKTPVMSPFFESQRNRRLFRLKPKERLTSPKSPKSRRHVQSPSHAQSPSLVQSPSLTRKHPEVATFTPFPLCGSVPQKTYKRHTKVEGQVIKSYLSTIDEVEDGREREPLICIPIALSTPHSDGDLSTTRFSLRGLPVKTSLESFVTRLWFRDSAQDHVLPNATEAANDAAKKRFPSFETQVISTSLERDLKSSVKTVVGPLLSLLSSLWAGIRTRDVKKCCEAVLLIILAIMYQMFGFGFLFLMCWMQILILVLFWWPKFVFNLCLTFPLRLMRTRLLAEGTSSPESQTHSGFRIVLENTISRFAQKFTQLSELPQR